MDTTRSSRRVTGGTPTACPRSRPTSGGATGGPFTVRRPRRAARPTSGNFRGRPMATLAVTDPAKGGTSAKDGAATPCKDPSAPSSLLEVTLRQPYTLFRLTDQSRA